MDATLSKVDTKHAEDVGPTVLYNGACPVCSREIGHYRRRCDEAAVNVGWSDITSDPETLHRLGIGLDEAKKRLHVIDRNGQMHVGVAAFLVLWRRVPGFAWLARLVGLPVIRPCAEWLYDHILAPALYAWNRRHGR